MLPSGRFAADAEYLQQGDDLLLIAPDGTTVIVRDYFLTDSPPDLLTPEGGRVTPAIVKAFTPPEAVGQFAQVGATEAEAVGQISSAVGKVFVVRTNGVREAVGAGDPIFQGDVIETAEGGAVDILFIDKTTFAISGDARLAIDKLVYDPDTHEGSSSYSILKGMFVFSSGEIAKINPLDMTVKTTIATIGIRGTKVAGEVNPAGEQSKFTILEGEIIILTDAGYVVLSEANETTFVTSFDAPPSEAILFSAGEIDSFYSNVKSISNGYYDPSTTQQDGSRGEQGTGPGGETGSEGTGGGEGEGGEPDLDQLADALADLAPAAGPGGEGEGGAGEGEGDAFEGEVSLLRVDQSPFRTDPEQAFNLTANAGDELNGENDGGGIGGSAGGSANTGSGPTTFGGNEDDNGNSAAAAAEDVAFADGGLLFDLRESTGPETIVGSDGNDRIFGGAGNELIDAGDGDDTVDAGAGDDVIVAGFGGGDDTYDGGSGNDTLIFSSWSGPVTVDLEAGTAVGAETDSDVIANVENVVGGSGNDTITGDDGDNSLNGGAGDDNIVGAMGADTLDGNDGRDTLDGGGGDDLLRGGDDDDVYRITLGEGADRIEDSGGDGDRIVVTGIGESLAAFGGTIRVGNDLIIELGDDDVVIADHFANGTVEAITFEFEDGADRTLVLATGVEGGDADGIIIGTDSGETLDGGGGDDFLIGKGGNDVLLGGEGNDTFLVSGTNEGFDRVNGGTGFDRILGGDEDDVVGLFRFTDDDTVEEIDSGGGANVIQGTSSQNVLDFSETILTNIARIEGLGGNDTITGSAGDDTISGGAGNDRLKGGAGDDDFLVSGSSDGFDQVTGAEPVNDFETPTVSIY